MIHTRYTLGGRFLTLREQPSDGNPAFVVPHRLAWPLNREGDLDKRPDVATLIQGRTHR